MISDLETCSTALRPLAACQGFFVPDEDAGHFQSLPDSVRRDVDLLFEFFKKIASAKKIDTEIRRLVNGYTGRRGFSFQSLRAKYYKYLRTQDWRTLVDWTRVPKHARPGAATGASDNESLPPDFLDHLKGLFQSNQRKSEPAIRLLYREWRAGKEIPGYGTWQEWFQDEHPHHPLPHKCPPDLPRGWSRGNLRRHIPEDAELALTRQGVSAALQHLPDILTTRDGLRPLEYVMFDDFRTDFRILVTGYASPVELNGLVALDVATGRPLRYGLRPALPRDDGAKDHLKLRDMKTLVAGLLLQYGIPRFYTMNFIVENATAAIRDAFALALAELARSLGSVLAVHRTQMICGTAIWAGYKDKALGNPKGKANLESTFNLLHNEAGFLPGQIGRRYDAGPMDQAGRTKEAEALIRTSRHLAPHDRAALKYPFLNSSQARLVMTDIWNQIAHRTDHAMEAFEVVGEWRQNQFADGGPPPGEWRPDCELITFDPRPDNIEWRNPPRKESPMERWQRLVAVEDAKVAADVRRRTDLSHPAFQTLHPGAVARLYDEHKSATITNYEIYFQYDKEPCYFRIANAIGRVPSRGDHDPLRNGAAVLCYFDPSDLSWIHLTDGQGGYLGSIPRTRGIKRTDKEALKAEFTRKREQLHDLQDTVSARVPEQTEERISDLDTNITLLNQTLENASALDITTPTGLNPSAQGCDEGATLGSTPRNPHNPEGVEPAYSRAITAAKFADQVAQRKANARRLQEKDLAALADKALLTNVRT